MIRKIFLIVFIMFSVVFNTIKVSSNDPEDKLIQVEIKGAVERPGVYEIERGSSLEDLLNTAIPADSADLSGFSLSSNLFNGEIIVVPEISTAKLVSINSAGIDELCSLPGIGPALAMRIIDYRNRYGSFSSIEDLMNVKGIGNAKFAKIKQLITL